jgi:hypothetical protein
MHNSAKLLGTDMHERINSMQSVVQTQLQYLYMREDSLVGRRISSVGLYATVISTADDVAASIVMLQ